MAESSLAVPGVNAVVDVGLHRREVCNDHTRMSMLATDWCSQASMIQRRGRAGRTSECIAVRMLPRAIYKELGEIDRGGVERADIYLSVYLKCAYACISIFIPLFLHAYDHVPPEFKSKLNFYSTSISMFVSVAAFIVMPTFLYIYMYRLCLLTKSFYLERNKRSVRRAGQRREAQAFPRPRRPRPPKACEATWYDNTLQEDELRLAP